MASEDSHALVSSMTSQILEAPERASASKCRRHRCLDHELREPFLLIVRTGRIVTAEVTTLTRSRDTNEYRQILGVSSK